MKKILYMAIMAVGIVMTACSSDDDNIASGAEQIIPSEGESIAFSSRMGDQLELLGEENLDGGTVTTRSTMSDGALASWSTSDKISISDGTLMYTYLPKDGSISGTECSFESKTSASFLTDGTGDEGTFYAFYPADAVLGWNGTTVTTRVYTEQKYSENVENSGVMGPYMVATATTTGGGANANFTFGHICSVIDVDLSTFDGGEVESVALYANSQVSVAGSMQFNVSTKAATISGNDGAGYSASLQSEVVRVSQINATQPTVRFYILPVKQTAGFTITVRCSDGKYYTKSSGTSVGNDELNTYITTQSGITGGTLCKPYYKKYNFGTKGSARTQNWLAMVPGNVKFNFLSIPGAHDAATSGCTSYTDYTICQNITVEQLLAKGCRALDLRPHTSKNDNGDPTITHASYSTNTTLGSNLSVIKSFLDANPTETVFVLLNEEDAGSHSTDWSNRVWNTLNGYTSTIASYGWKGNLNPCRGKMVVIFREAYADGTNTGDLGCGRVGWGSSFNAKNIMFGTSSGSSDSYTLWYQDEYDTSSSSDKLTNLTNMLTNYIAANETDATKTYINNTNIAKWSLFGSSTANTTLANNVNTAVLGSATFTEHTGKFGIMMTDFLFSSDQKGDQMFELIHQQNYKYVYKGRTRCASSTSGTDTGVDISADEYADNGTVYSRRQ